MKGKIAALLMLVLVMPLAGCGGGGSNPPPTVVTQIISNSANDGDIELTAPSSFVVTQGMSPTVQSVFAGIDPVTLTETRAFLDFPLGGTGGVPVGASIVSATLDIVISSIQPPTAPIPVRIDLVNIQPPTLIATDFDRSIQPALASITTSILPSDLGRHVFVDATSLMQEAQRLGLQDFQVRILEDVGPVSPGLFEINDTTGVDRATLAPLLEVTYY